jgi:hypothetical protein
MILKKLKQKFLAAMPVIGPHAHIEAELMLAGKKPLTWVIAAPDETVYQDPYMQKDHEGRKLLDQAVREGKLIAKDVEFHRPNEPQYRFTARHYAQPDQKENLDLVTAFNEKAFNFLDYSDVNLDKDLGHYVGYKKRDIFFFNHITNSGLLPPSIVNKIIDLNASCQAARRNAYLQEAGYDLQQWYDQFPKTISPPSNHS